MEIVVCILAVGLFAMIGIPIIAFFFIFWFEKVVGPVFDFLFDLVDL